ncbi:MAG TPA: ATP-dependent Clp protease proteolytic subunit [Cytophagales bacterium]|nr:ATP-dependent Clp protease proteolytic subunit [Cytophagales bacterium]
MSVINSNSHVNFKVTNSGDLGQISITDEIGWWRTSGQYFTQLVNDLLAKGVKDLEIYINSPGGSCFDANEIVNQLKRFKGTKTAILGALCASAGTTIASSMDKVKAAKNCMYMIHNVSMGASIYREADIDAARALYKGLMDAAIDVYHKKTGIDKETIKTMMDDTTWMTAQRANELKFIDEILDKDDELPKDAANLIKNYANIPEVLNLNIQSLHNRQTNNEPQNEKTEMKEVAKMLGLPENASEAEVAGKVKSLQDAVNSASQRAIDNLVEDATKKGFDKDMITNLAKADFASTEKMVKNFKGIDQENHADEVKESTPSNTPEAGRLSDVVNLIKNMTGGTTNTNKDWTLRDWETNDPDGLKKLMANNAKEYARLFKNQTGMAITENDVKELLKDAR